MFFLNLSLAEFAALFTAASGVVVALYLLDRSRRGVVVATLRFWTAAERPVESTRRRRIRQWPSLLLQLASIACLLAALSQLRLGSPDTTSRDHVLILDASSWMNARDGSSNLMEDARAQALAYLRALPATDRLLVIRAGALATPVTAFETDRRKVERAIRAAVPGQDGLDLAQAFDLARRLQDRTARRPGEIVFAGSPRTFTQDGSLDPPPNLRLLTVRRSPENAGLRKIGLRHSPSESGLWHAHVSVRNYGRRAQDVDLALQFAGAPAGSRRLRLDAGSEQEAAFEFRTRAPGLLEARIRARWDAFDADDRAVVELPSLAQLAVTVCSAEPQLFRPLLESIPNIRAAYFPVAACPKIDEGIALYDRLAPDSPASNAIYVEPPALRSPVAVRTTAAAVAVGKWRLDHPLTAGLRVQDLRLASTLIFGPSNSEIAIAEAAAGPVLVAREAAGRRAVVFGFHPFRSSLRFELATPLLFANALRWMAPGSFRRLEIYAGSAGSVLVNFESAPGPAQVKVLGPGESPLPFSIQGSALRFFAGSPGAVRVIAGDREQIHSLTLPSVPDTRWDAPASVRRGVPRAVETVASWRDIWYWLALAGGIGLLIEWLWFSPAGTGFPRRLSSHHGTSAAAPGEFWRRAS